MMSAVRSRRVEIDSFDAVLGEHFRRRHRIGRNLAKAKRLRFLADFSRNRSETNHAEGEIGKRRNGQERPNSPAAVLDLIVIVRDAASNT